MFGYLLRPPPRLGGVLRGLGRLPPRGFTATDCVVCISSPHSGHFTRSFFAAKPVSVPTGTERSTPYLLHFSLTHFARRFMCQILMPDLCKSSVIIPR